MRVWFFMKCRHLEHRRFRVLPACGDDFHIAQSRCRIGGSHAIGNQGVIVVGNFDGGLCGTDKPLIVAHTVVHRQHRHADLVNGNAGIFCHQVGGHIGNGTGGIAFGGFNQNVLFFEGQIGFADGVF